MNGLTVFYLNPIEKYQQEEHSYPLVPGTDRYIYITRKDKIKIEWLTSRLLLDNLCNQAWHRSFTFKTRSKISWASRTPNVFNAVTTQFHFVSSMSWLNEYAHSVNAFRVIWPSLRIFPSWVKRAIVHFVIWVLKLLWFLKIKLKYLSTFFLSILVRNIKDKLLTKA